MKAYVLIALLGLQAVNAVQLGAYQNGGENDQDDDDNQGD